MYYISKIKVSNSIFPNLTHITALYVNGIGWKTVQQVVQDIELLRLTYKVDRFPHPTLTVVNEGWSKYVKSANDYTAKDNLLSLPKITSSTIFG